MKKICCYVWDPTYEEGLNPEDTQTEDGMSVGNPEAKASQSPTQEPDQEPSQSTASDTESDEETDDESDFEAFGTLGSSETEHNFERHKAGTIKKTIQDIKNEKIIISPFAVCGGQKVGSLRQAFNPPKDKNKKKSIRSSRYSIATIDSRVGSTTKADPALKVRQFCYYRQ